MSNIRRVTKSTNCVDCYNNNPFQQNEGLKSYAKMISNHTNTESCKSCEPCYDPYLKKVFTEGCLTGEGTECNPLSIDLDCIPSGGGEVINIYNSDGTLTDETRIVSGNEFTRSLRFVEMLYYYAQAMYLSLFGKTIGFYGDLHISRFHRKVESEDIGNAGRSGIIQYKTDIEVDAYTENVSFLAQVLNEASAGPNVRAYISNAGSGEDLIIECRGSGSTFNRKGRIRLNNLPTDNTASQILAKDANGLLCWRDVSSL